MIVIPLLEYIGITINSKNIRKLNYMRDNKIMVDMYLVIVDVGDSQVIS